MNNDKPKAIVSLFDLTGGMVRPWADAGYDCFIFDAQHPDGITFSAKGLACFGSRENAGSLFINTVGGDASTWAEPIARIMEVYVCTDGIRVPTLHPPSYIMGQVARS